VLQLCNLKSNNYIHNVITQYIVVQGVFQGALSFSCYRSLFL